jgi:ligand-binding sensor domain-containing protein
LGSDKVREIIRDSQGNIWVTCYVSGVSRFNGNNWESFSVKNGLCSDDTIALAADKRGGVWVSAYWGVSYFDGQQWSSYSNVDPNGLVVGGSNPMKDWQNLTFVDAELGAADVIFVDSR